MYIYMYNWLQAYLNWWKNNLFIIGLVGEMNNLLIYHLHFWLGLWAVCVDLLFLGVCVCVCVCVRARLP